MLPQRMSRSEFRPDDSPPDPTLTLEHHRLAGFAPDLALDFVLNTLVVRAAEAIHANSAALALASGDEMVCRAATGPLAPDLGVTLNTRDGLSGACLETRQPQLSVDAEFDPRVDPALSRSLGIRSILIVPVLDSNDKNALTGILEVFSPSTGAFSHSDQKLLEGFAEECARIRDASIELGQQEPAAAIVRPELVPPASILPGFDAAGPLPARPPYETWTLVLGGLAILAIIAVSFLIGSRIGWLRPAAPPAQISQPIPAEPLKPADAPKSTDATKSADAPKSTKTNSKPAAKSTAAPAPAADELVVYEKGKIVFRMKSDSSKPDRAKSQPAKPDSTQPNSSRQGSDSAAPK
jgi:GAF domain